MTDVFCLMYTIHVCVLQGVRNVPDLLLISIFSSIALISNVY